MTSEEVKELKAACNASNEDLYSPNGFDSWKPVRQLEWVEAALADRERLLELVKGLEWRGFGVRAMCPMCGEFRSSTHHPDCALAAILKEMGE